MRWRWWDRRNKVSGMLISRVTRVLCICCLPLAAASSLAANAGVFPDEAAIRKELKAFVEVHRGAPGVVLGLIDSEGRRVVAVGESGRSERPGLDGATRFEIGSITKTFTGLLLAEMVHSGEVSVDQRVGSLFPKTIPLDNGVEDTTLEALATHTSGLPTLPINLQALGRPMSVDPYRGSTADEVFRSVGKTPEVFLDRTENLVYSNLGYALLGRLLERRAGRPYEELLRQRILEPYGLGSIAIAHSEKPAIELARGHGPGGRPVHYWHVDGYAPAGCLIASTYEMLDYLALQLEASRPAVAEAQRLRKLFPNGSGIGLGWFHQRIGGHRLVWHTGGTGGFRSFAGFLPAEGRGFILLANGQGDLDALARRLLDPAEPPLRAHEASAFRIGITLTLLAWGPLLLVLALRHAAAAARGGSGSVNPRLTTASGGAPEKSTKPTRLKIDRLDVIRLPLLLAILLVCADRWGAWLDVPFAAWWAVLAISVVAYMLLVRGVRPLPWRRGGVWSATGRGLTTAFWLAVLAQLFA